MFIRVIFFWVVGGKLIIGEYVYILYIYYRIFLDIFRESLDYYFIILKWGKILKFIECKIK